MTSSLIFNECHKSVGLSICDTNCSFFYIAGIHWILWLLYLTYSLIEPFSRILIYRIQLRLAEDTGVLSYFFNTCFFVIISCIKKSHLLISLIQVTLEADGRNIALFFINFLRYKKYILYRYILTVQQMTFSQNV